jgi:hypothetical protein
MQTVNLVKQAIKDKAPALHRQLSARGELNQYATDLAEEISSQVVTLTMAQRVKGGWDKLGPLECAAKMRIASSLNRELVLAEMLELPSDETTPSSPDAATDSPTTT